MALIGKLVGHVEIKSTGMHSPNDIAPICPDKLQSCDLLAGQRGVPGSTFVGTIPKVPILSIEPVS
ncbi:hypothetical protein OSB04_023223 [Centaurea solstitialis]|uniref:Uncharacterized protein n=1 Tax=Centaurea solstitialis TaxID=347529 RepID=A0AA38WCP4_9ASTR|nr:hypothetical protein OSB04_023223 [Centaurea solstitialis]